MKICVCGSAALLLDMVHAPFKSPLNVIRRKIVSTQPIRKHVFPSAVWEVARQLWKCKLHVPVGPKGTESRVVHVLSMESFNKFNNRSSSLQFPHLRRVVQANSNVFTNSVSRSL